VALIIGSLAAEAIVGNRGGLAPTLVVASVVAILTAVTGLTIRGVVARLSHPLPANHHVEDLPTGGVAPHHGPS
jgi:hypothetical protein